MAMSAGLVGAIVVLMAGAPGLRKNSLVIADAGIRFGADAIATLTKGSNSLTDSPRESSRIESASGEAAVAPVALRGFKSPVTGDSRSVQVKADNFELKPVDLRAESVLAGAPESAAPAHAMASSARFTVGIAEGTSSTLTTPDATPRRNLLIAAQTEQPRRRRARRLSQRFRPLRPKTCRRPRLRSPQPSATPEPAAPARATASSAQSPIGTADGTSSTLTTAVVASLSQSPRNDLDRATTPGPDRTPIASVSSAADQGLAATGAQKPATERDAEPAAPARATASSAQSPIGTADGTSSTLTTAVAASLSQSPRSDLGRATTPGPDRTPIASVSSAADPGLAGDRGSEARNRARRRSRPPLRRRLPAQRSPLSGPRTERHRRSQPPFRRPYRSLLVMIWTEQPRRDQTERQSRRSLPLRIRAWRRPGLRSPQSEAASARGAGRPCAGDRQLSPVPYRDRGRNVIDAGHRRCGAPSHPSAGAASTEQPRRDRTRRQSLRSLPLRIKSLPATEAPKPAIPKHAIKRAPKPERAAHARGDCQLSSVPCRDRGRNVIDAQRPCRGDPIAIS